MKVTLTAKLKLHTDAEQFQALRATQVAYRDALNYVSRYAFAHGKMSNKVALQEGTYQEIWPVSAILTKRDDVPYNYD
jgi:predicted transposase